jgi:hypothetical protein
MLKLLLLTLLLNVVMISRPINSFAYTDQITVKADEAWQAAQEVLKTSGFHKLDHKTKTLQTKWIQDRVVRKGKGVLKNFTSETVERRYRLTVRVIQRDFDTEIDIRGSFQERTMGNNHTSISWKKVRTQSEDLDIERAIFMRILNRLELARTSL